MAASQPTILISGAGIAGPILAYWLSRAGMKSTVVERSPSARSTGQQIDIRGAGLTIVRKMGLEEEIRAKTTKEEGLSFVNGKGKIFADFPVDQAGGRSFTSDIEILRGRLAEIFYEKSLAQGDVEYVFGDYITDLEEKENKVYATFNKSEPRQYDLVIGADGQSSKTRDIAFGKDPNYIKALGQYVSYFTIPYEERHGKFAQWYNATGGRGILLRPDSEGFTRAFLTIMDARAEAGVGAGVAAQKQLMHELFADAGWEAANVLKEMDQADDYYYQSVLQVKMPAWHKGRVALIGDAGYCPSPITGMGTTLAIVGAYNLAGAIKQHPGDHEAAFAQYDRVMQPIVRTAQSLPPGAPAIASPQTWWGLKIFTTVMWAASASGVARILERLSLSKAEKIDVPEYGL